MITKERLMELEKDCNAIAILDCCPVCNTYLETCCTGGEWAEGFAICENKTCDIYGKKFAVNENARGKIVIALSKILDENSD